MSRTVTNEITAHQARQRLLRAVRVAEAAASPAERKAAMAAVTAAAQALYDRQKSPRKPAGATWLPGGVG
jgi:hypothetical protein